MQESTTKVQYAPNQWIRVATLRGAVAGSVRTPVFTLGFEDQVIQFSPLLVKDPHGPDYFVCRVSFLSGGGHKQGPSVLKQIRTAMNDANDAAVDVCLTEKSTVSLTITGDSDWKINSPYLLNPEPYANGTQIINIPANLGFHGTYENNATLMPDGTMICCKTVEVDVLIDVAWGSLYDNASKIELGNWEIPFVSRPQVSYNFIPKNANALIETNGAITKESAGNIYLVRPNIFPLGTIQGTVQVTAVGRWYWQTTFGTDEVPN